MYNQSYQEYRDYVRALLFKTGTYKSLMHVPDLKKIVLNIGFGKFARDNKSIEIIKRNLELIACQKPIATYAKKSIAQFKIRAGMEIGTKVTLRRKQMFEFTKRLVYLAMQRMNDFHGISYKSVDGMGNVSFGIDDCSIFYEMPLDNDKGHGMDIAFVTSARNDQDGIQLLKEWKLPIRRLQNVA